MDLPRRLSYNAKWGPMIGLLAFGLALSFSGSLGGFPRILLLVGLPFAALGLVGLARRAFSPRSLELGKDAIFLPPGFFRNQIEVILYAQIESLSEKNYSSAIAQTKVLNIATRGRQFEISSRCLPGPDDYVAIKDFLGGLPGLPERRTARQNAPAEPGKFCFQCNYEGNGAIYNTRGEVLWRMETRHRSRPRYPYGLFHLPDFAVSDPSGREFITIKRESGRIFSNFTMLQEGKPVCRIQQRSVLLNRYTLDFPGASKWKFHLPLFTVLFGGSSETGATIRVRLAAHQTWFVQIDEAAITPHLIVALAFIHRERLRNN